MIGTYQAHGDRLDTHRCLFSTSACFDKTHLSAAMFTLFSRHLRAIEGDL